MYNTFLFMLNNLALVTHLLRLEYGFIFILITLPHNVHGLVYSYIAFLPGYISIMRLIEGVRIS